MDVPQLDDITFARLVEEAKKRIPQYSPEWTDYNLHDPGITLIELLAWLTELQIFFLDQITDKDQLKFLKLLGASIPKNENLKEAIFSAQKDLRKPYRAVTLEDYEFLAKETPNVNIARAHAFWNNNRVVVIVGVKSLNGDSLASAKEEDKSRVCLYLDKGRLLTTLVEIADPRIVRVNVQADVRPKPLASWEMVKNQIIVKLNTYLNPLIGGSDGKGWPFGRSVYKSEIIALIESIEGVDCVQNMVLSVLDSAPGDFRIIDGNVVLSKHALADSGLNSFGVIGSQEPCRRYTL